MKISVNHLHIDKYFLLITDSLLSMKHKSIPLISNTHRGGIHKKATNLGYDKIRDNREYS